jgi:hypothetical protein
LIFNFKLEHDALSKFASSRKQLGSKTNWQANAVVVLSPKENKVSSYYSGNRSVAKFDFDMTDYVEVKAPDKTQKQIYFVVRSETFANILDKAVLTKNTAEFKIDTSGNHVEIKAGKSRFTTTCFDASTFDDNSVQDIVDTISGLQNGVEFTKDTCTFTLTPEVIKFYNSIIGSMGTFNRGNAIEVENNKLRYADTLAILEYTTSTNISDSKKVEYLHSEIYELVKPTLAKVDTLPIVYSQSRSYVYIKNPVIGFEAVIGVPEISFKYPDASELNLWIPLETDRAIFTINKNELTAALDQFSGIFEATNWKLQQLRIKAIIDPNDTKLHFSWDDDISEVTIDCEFKQFEQLGKTITETEFVIPTGQLLKLLAITDETDDIKLIFNDLNSDVENGSGIIIETKNYNVIVAKLEE